MSTKTVLMTMNEIQQLKLRLSQAEIRKTPPYAQYQLKLSDCIITAYDSGKVVFQGDGAEAYASTYPNQGKTEQKAPSKQRVASTFPQCGSDEVGTGDYFGPVTVCATYVCDADIPHLQSLGIQDSKAINDQTIRILAPQLMERLPYSLLILKNDKYNEIHNTNNMVAIKAKLHNQAYVHLQKKVTVWPKLLIVDQFVQGPSYYRYLKDEKEVMRNIHFETKAENKFLSVACASIIARYAFLKAFDTMCETYDFQFLKGAGAKVDTNIRAFVERFGKDELKNVAKLHFINTEKAFQ